MDTVTMKYTAQPSVHDKALNYRGAGCIERYTSSSEAEHGRRLPCLGNYHRKLKSMIAVELKVNEFKPEHSQQLNWYLHLLDKTIKYPEDNPSIGILLCKSKSQITVEYALELVNKPMGVATYSYSELPENIASKLPNEQQFVNILSQNFDNE